MVDFAPSAERQQRVRDYLRGKDRNASGKVRSGFASDDASSLGLIPFVGILFHASRLLMIPPEHWLWESWGKNRGDIVLLAFVRSAEAREHDQAQSHGNVAELTGGALLAVLFSRHTTDANTILLRRTVVNGSKLVIKTLIH